MNSAAGETGDILGF